MERLIRAGQRLFHQGDAASHLFELRAGILRQTRTLESGERQVIGFHFPGDIVGFAPDGIHRDDCTAITDGRAIVHHADARTLADRSPELQPRLWAAAMQEIGRAQDQLVMLGRRSASAKVEAFVQYLIERAGNWRDGQVSVDIPMSRYDIADFLGVAVETVSRSFTDLRQAGVIEMTDPHRLTIRHPAALANLR
ncbi:MAG: helix-turn-helix domain-containing protein [Pseudomonadota bacterium]